LHAGPGSYHCLLAGCLLAVGSFALADNVEFGGPDSVPRQLERDTQDWLGFKQGLQDRGLSFTLDYSAVSLNASDSLDSADDDAAGGMARFYGQWEAVGRGTANTGSLIWKVEYRHAYTDVAPKGLLFETGTLGLAVPPFSDDKERLTNLYWAQRLNGGKTTVVGGLLDATDYVDVYMLASPWTGFLNFAFSTGSNTIALPGDATLGLAAGHMLGNEFFVIGGITDMNSEPTDPLETFDSFFNDNKYFKSIELGWAASQGKIYTDNAHLTFWHADESEVQGTDDGWGVTFSASRLMGNWLPFVRGGYSDDAGTLTEKSVSLGTGYLGMGGKNNKLGFAVNWADTDNDDDQFTTELFYLMEIAPGLEITADIQWIRDPALNPGKNNLYVAGLRARVAL
jgi:porin